MQLLSGADISIRFDKEYRIFIVAVGVGPTYKSFSDKDVVKAIGKACLLQAGFTPEKLKAELEKQ